MRYEIIIVLLIVVTLYCVNELRNENLRNGIRFCEKVENLLNAYEKAFNSKIGNISTKYDTQKEYYKTAYDPKNPKSFFTQLEFGIADALDEYDKIKDNEFNYVEEDWYCILEHYDALKELSHRIRYESWKRGFRKIKKTN